MNHNVIASAAKQSSAEAARLDCFVDLLLAMTRGVSRQGKDQRSQHCALRICSLLYIIH
jgi:hypothetical protein